MFGAETISLPYLDSSKSIETRVEDLLSRLTLQEKDALVYANSTFSVAGVPRLGIAELWMDDGPMGVREEVGVGFRNLNRTDDFDRAQVLIVCAGMEGALPSVVGGLVKVPVIAVPTSVGYGASFGGIAALLGMLNSCASGITVVNIDNGFGAAMAAIRIIGGIKVEG